jgi:hypothetical protein
MLHRSLAVTVLLAVSTVATAEQTEGAVTKVEEGAITVQLPKSAKDKPGEKKTFKVSKDIKITIPEGKDRKEVKLTLDELKTMSKKASVFVTVTHAGDKATEVTIEFLFPFGHRR